MLYKSLKKWYTKFEWLGKEESFSLIQAVVFDLNGVLADTGDCHRQAWRQMAKEQGIPLEEKTSRLLPGLEDQEALELLLKKAERAYSPAERMALIARKNDLYAELISTLSPAQLQPGAIAVLESLRDLGLKTAAAAPDENAPAVLRQLGLSKLLDTVALWPRDGREEAAAQTLRQIATRLGLSPAGCLAVVSPSHEEAALRCGMWAVLIGDNQEEGGALLWADSLAQINLPALIHGEIV